MVIAEVLSIPGMARRRVMALSKGTTILSSFSSSLAMDCWTNSRWDRKNQRKQVVCDGRGRFAKHVGNKSIKGYIADSESILETILFTAFTANKFETVSAFTYLGLAIVIRMLSSKRLETGTQYLPVDSIQTSNQLLSNNHCLNCWIELLKVENLLFK